MRPGQTFRARRPSKPAVLRLAPVLLLAVLVSACPGQAPPPDVPRPAAPVAQEKPVVWRMSKSGVGFRLSDADAETPPPPAPVNAKALGDADAKKLLGRLPAMTALPEEKAFALREKSLRPPRPGQTIATPFPPAGSRPPPAVDPDARGPLRVLRHAPEGDVSVAPSLSVTFSQPMVAVTSHAEIAKASLPIRLSPEPPGKWRWIGTQTLLFEPGERFPMATDYTVTIPDGVRSATGSALGKPSGWKFSTPALEITEFHPSPYEATKLEPTVFVAFNQKIDRSAILGHLTVKAGRAEVAMRFATDDEVGADRVVRQLSQRSPEGQWLALRPVVPLPKDTSIVTVLGRGAPSAEGPKPAGLEQSRTFRTYPPMALREVRCAWRGECPPLAPWTLRFSNEIDRGRFDTAMVSVEPALPGLAVEVHHDAIVVRGRSKGRTKYTVTVAGSLRDVHAQTLEQPVSRTVDVGSAEPVLFSEDRPLVILDPAFGPKMSVFSVNRPALRVKLLRVQPSDYSKYLDYRREWDWERKAIAPPGKLVATFVVRPDAAPDELVETPIDLSKALDDGVGQVLAIVEPTTPPKKDRWGGIHKDWVRAWVQVTQLGVQAFADHEDLHGWVTKLSDGTAVEGAEVGLLGTPAVGKTAANGIASMRGSSTAGMLFARVGKDTVLAPEHDSYHWSPSLNAETPYDVLRWFVFDDRKLYKPGESVRVKGWVRIMGARKGGDVARPAQAANVLWQVNDAQGAEIAKGQTPMDDSGGFHLAFDLPKNVNLGSASVSLSVDRSVGASEGHSHSFEVQEFRRPEYEVTATSTEGPHSVGDAVVATVSASYYAGGGLPSAETEWSVTSSEAHYTPPNRSGYQFGRAPTFRWWEPPQKPVEPETWSARTNAAGKHRLRIDLEGVDPAYARRLALEATVTDVNRQAWTARNDFIVHPASVYVGLRQNGTFVEAGQTLTVASLTTDTEGEIVAGRPVVMKAVRIESRWTPDGFEESEKDVGACEIASAAEDVPCEFVTKEPGLHQVTAIVTDVWGRKSQTSLRLWVLGPDRAGNESVRGETVEIVADRTEYAPGDTARLLVMAPFAPAEGVLTVRRQGVVELRRFRMDQRAQVVDVKVDSKWLPNAWARVDLAGAKVRENENGVPDESLPKRPAFASGQTLLKIPPADRTLKVVIDPKKRFLAPGASVDVDLHVRDAAGRPVPDGRLAVVVVDESVLALAGYQLPDPLGVFYAERPADVRDLETRFRVALMRPDMARLQVSAVSKNGGGDRGEGIGLGSIGTLGRGAGGAAGPMRARLAMKAKKSAEMSDSMAMPAASAPAPAMEASMSEDKAGASAAPLTVRSDFSALAAFIPDVRADAQGRATVKVKLPDNLTRYRVVAVAASGSASFGTSEDALTARLPLMVRPSLPRFLNYGDQFELPVVLQNQTSQSVEVRVAARVANAKLLGPIAQQVTVPPNDRVEVRFPAAAASPGTARFQIGAVSPMGTDASEQEIPVWTPATTEAFATYGQVDSGAIAQQVKPPSDAVPDFGGLELTTSSTALQGLTDAVVYLVKYPFECNEQISSRVLAIAALRDVLQAFEAAGLPRKDALIKSVAQDVKKLESRQHWSGGWDWWRQDREPSPFVSLHVTHALLRAKSKGFAVPKGVLDAALRYVGELRWRIPHWYSPETRRDLEAYAVYVRRLGGFRDVEEAKRIVREAGGVSKLSMEAVGWIWSLATAEPGLAAERDEIRRVVNNAVNETAGKAHFVTRVSQESYLSLQSDRRTDGILLETLIADQPDSDLVPKLVAGLLGHRKKGRWGSTQENAWVLLALDRYFATYEKATPDFVARAWLGEELAAEHAYRGRTTDRHHVDVPMSFLAKRGESSMILAKDGTGRLYYRLGMQYAPRELLLPPAEHGFAVTREYEAVDGPTDVTRDASGTWRVKAGAMVRVRLKMATRGRRHHVALVDPLPAGFEAMNPALAMVGTVPPDPSSSGSSNPWWWSSAWYEHQNLRDERVEAFTSLLWEGVYDYTYVARATTPGNFVVPPPRAEEMYEPETFGRGASDRVIVR